jgi:thiaminase/transcriptional activator TenA
MAATPEDPANMAYTRYVLERGLAGDGLDLAVALAPCIVGYAEVAAFLLSSPDTILDDNPYREWIETYADEDYQDVAWGHASHLDRLMAARGGPGRIAALSKTFHDATRLEIGFWQMGVDRVS